MKGLFYVAVAGLVSLILCQDLQAGCGGRAGRGLFRGRSTSCASSSSVSSCSTSTCASSYTTSTCTGNSCSAAISPSSLQLYTGQLGINPSQGVQTQQAMILINGQWFPITSDIQIAPVQTSGIANRMIRISPTGAVTNLDVGPSGTQPQNSSSGTLTQPGQPTQGNPIQLPAPGSLQPERPSPR